MSLLRELAKWPNRGPAPILRYDQGRQISYVKDGDQWIESWRARSLEGTKKFDIETGEDSKGP
jgi:hypothetical protein